MPAPSGRPTLVFLHEGLGSVSMWRDFPKDVAKAANAGLLVYSRYGHGQSDVLTSKRDVSYMHDEALTVLPELLRDFGLDKPILIGHSDGASIALIYAGAHPGAVQSLVLMAPHLFVEQLSVDSIAGVRQRYDAMRDKLARHHRDADATFYGWNDIWLDPRFRSWNIEEYVRKITAPILAIQGRDDEYGTLEQLDALERDAQGPVTRIVLEHCGHSPHRDQPEAVLASIASWI